MDLDLSNIEKLIINELQQELIGQGHKATGSLINSMEGRTMVLPNSVVVEILMDDYSQYVNDGRKPGGKKVPISVLIDWVERRGIASGNKDVKNAAFAIQQKIFREGSPTDGSFKFSNNGRRKGFIDFVIDNKLDPILAQLGDDVFQEFDALVTDIVKKFNKNNA